MNVDEALRAADPVRSPDLDPERVDALLASSRRRPDSVRIVAPRARSPRRVAAAVGIAAVLLIGTAAAVVAVHDARPRPAVATAPEDRRGDLARVFGPDVLVGRAQPVVSVPGPEDTTLTLWTAPAARGGTCAVVLDDVPSADPHDEVASCPSPTLPGDAPPVDSQLGDNGPWHWTSPSTRTAWTGWSALRGATAARIELRTAAGAVVTATPVDGTYVTGGIRADTPGCSVVVSLDGTGRQTDRVYPESDCDPGTQVVPTGPAQSAADVVEAPWGNAAAWTPAIGVIVGDLVEQPASKAADLPTGHTLITVQLQFYRSSGPPTDLPTDVPFVLLAGPQQQETTPDAGRDAPDSSLTGLDVADSVDGEAHILQRSFDVPTDLLGQLAVRIPGDATHPTVILLDSQRAL